MKTDANGRALSDGRRLFQIALQTMSPADMREMLGVSRMHVSYLASGERKPSLRLAALIERRLGIPCAAWDDA